MKILLLGFVIFSFNGFAASLTLDCKLAHFKAITDDEGGIDFSSDTTLFDGVVKLTDEEDAGVFLVLDGTTVRPADAVEASRHDNKKSFYLELNKDDETKQMGVNISYGQLSLESDEPFTVKHLTRIDSLEKLHFTMFAYEDNFLLKCQAL